MLSSGEKLGPYEIREVVGTGGMGEVYRGRDPRIGREVAIKVVAAKFSEEPARLSRFQQEARAAGMLNHPNILSIYDVGIENGCPYLVSELLEGETLRQKLNASSLPIRKVLDYALQIIKGLTAAHEKGIVHRDLKPENLFITKDGRLKILDFGLAKLINFGTIDPEQSKLQTEEVQSQAGTILGTIGYMSPEQVRGRTADHRSDIFSFGAILYEMLTGARAFQGESVADTMSAILNKDPMSSPLSSKDIPIGLQRIIDRCLEKEPAHRFQSAHDLAFALEAVSVSDSAHTIVDPQVTTSRKRNRKIAVWIAVSALLFLAGLVTAIGWNRSRSEPSAAIAPIQFSISRGEDVYPTNTTLPLISPDGKRIVYLAADVSGNRWLYLRNLDSLVAKRLAGTEGAFNCFWSADSRFIGFFSVGKLNKLDLQTGTVQAICDASIGRGGAWNQDNVILFAPSSNGALYRVPASGGEPVPVTQLKEKEISHRFPCFLPDGKHFLFLITGSGTTNGIHVGSLESKEIKFLLPSTLNAAFAPPDYLFYVHQSNLMLHRFDVSKLELQGTPRVVIENIGFAGATAQASFSVSATGVLTYRPSYSTQNQLTILDRHGQTSGTVGPEGSYEDPALSPDGNRLAITRNDLGTAQSVWIYDFQRQVFSRFTFEPAPCDDPTWTADGGKIIYSADGNIHVKPSNGAEEAIPLLLDQFDKVPVDSAPQGRDILFSIASPKTGQDIHILPANGKPYPLLGSEFYEGFPQLSPDGRFLAYTSDESERLEVYVRSFPNLQKGKWQISSSGGLQPRWRNDGKELFYLTPDGFLMAVPVDLNADHIQTGAPQKLFQTKDLSWDPRRHEYDVFPDGQRFIFCLASKTGHSPINVILNWDKLSSSQPISERP